MPLIATEIPGNGPSVANSIEHLVNAFLGEHPEIRFNRLIVIEHYGAAGNGGDAPSRDEEYTLVSFDQDPASGKLCRPSWKWLQKDAAEEWAGTAFA